MIEHNCWSLAGKQSKKENTQTRIPICHADVSRLWNNIKISRSWVSNDGYLSIHRAGFFFFFKWVKNSSSLSGCSQESIQTELWPYNYVQEWKCVYEWTCSALKGVLLWLLFLQIVGLGSGSPFIGCRFLSRRAPWYPGQLKRLGWNYTETRLASEK